MSRAEWESAKTARPKQHRHLRIETDWIGRHYSVEVFVVEFRGAVLMPEAHQIREFWHLLHFLRHRCRTTFEAVGWDPHSEFLFGKFLMTKAVLFFTQISSTPR